MRSGDSTKENAGKALRWDGRALMERQTACVLLRREGGFRLGWRGWKFLNLERRGSVMRRMGLAGLGVLALCAAGVMAQAPAGAPAGANGICKDGTYSMSASKSGACRGHKGVQTWYAATDSTSSAASAKTAAMPAPTPAPASTMAAKPAPTPAPAAPAAAPAPTASASTGKRLSPSQAAAAKTAAPGGGPGLVWLNTKDNVYHCNGDTYYGKTKAGAYMSEADAKAKGGRGADGKVCTGK